MNQDKQKPFPALMLGYSVLFILNALAALFGALVVVFTWYELSRPGEKWLFIVLHVYCLGGLVVMLPLLIATIVFVACARERVGGLFRWALLFLILVGILGDIAPFIPELRAVTTPLVEMFE
ncbi:MAG TPA: hypothetical protein VMZ06_13425 [Candidatus Bathyarchaeia archaeon]|nr:hypothetical protein [Candidatus Bathyarchaeia archaeon]